MIFKNSSLMRKALEYIHSIFYHIYSFLKNVEGGYASQTESRRALLTIYILGLCLTLIVIAAFQLITSTVNVVIIFAIISSILYFAFVLNDRFKKIDIKFSETKNQPKGSGLVTILFIISSIVFFVLNNPNT